MASVLPKQSFADIRMRNPEFNYMDDETFAEEYRKQFYPNMNKYDFDLYTGRVDNPYGLSDELSSGFTVGLSPYAAAAGGATAETLIEGIKGEGFSPIENFQEQLSKQKAEQSAYREEYPVRSTAANVVGGFAMGAGPYQKLYGTFKPMLGKGGAAVAAGGVTGGGMGAISGAANAPEGQAGEGALIGGSLGALLGAGLPAVGNFFKATLARVRNLSPWKNVKATSVRRIIKALEDDGFTPQDAGRFLDEMAASNKPAMLADIGDNTQKLAAYISKTPGAGRRFGQEAVKARQFGSQERIVGDLNKYISPETNVFQVADDLIKQREIASRPLFEAAFNRKIMISDYLNDLLERPALKSALGNAMKIAKNDGVDPRQLGIDFNEAGDVIFTSQPSSRTLHYVKMGLDSFLEKYRDPITRKMPTENPLVTSLQNLRKDFRRELVRVNPDYGKALKEFSGPSESIDVMELGRKFLRQQPEQIDRVLARLSPNDKEFYRMGVARAIRDLVETRGFGADTARQIMGTPRKRQLLEKMFDDPNDFKAFINSLDAESRMSSTYGKVTGGSPTAELIEEGASLPQAGVVEAGAQAAAGNPLGAIGALVRAGGERLKGVDDTTTEQIAKLLFQQDPRLWRNYYSSLARPQFTTGLIGNPNISTGLFYSPIGASITSQMGDK